MILPEAQYMISTVACGLRLQIITSYKKHASFPPFTSSLIFPFAIPLKGTLLGLTIAQVCLHRCNNTSCFLPSNVPTFPRHLLPSLSPGHHNPSHHILCLHAEKLQAVPDFCNT